MAPGLRTAEQIQGAAQLLVAAGWKALIVAALLATVLGVWACGAHAKKVRIHDPSECVLDEVAGQWLALLPAALAVREDWRPFAMAFFLFRLFDIFKPYPIRKLERLHAGLGVVADDVLAGIYAAALLWVGHLARLI